MKINCWAIQVTVPFFEDRPHFLTTVYKTKKEAVAKVNKIRWSAAYIESNLSVKRAMITV